MHTHTQHILIPSTELRDVLLEAALPSTRWRTDWWRLLEERDRISCQQRAARPPFRLVCTHLVTFSRELVFHRRHWWCDMSWDEMRLCAEIEARLTEWSRKPPRAGNGAKLPPPYQLLVICCISA